MIDILLIAAGLFVGLLLLVGAFQFYLFIVLWLGGRL